MAAARRVTESEHWLRAGKWQRWSYDMFLGVDLYGSTLGIPAWAASAALARRAAGFGMTVLYHNRSRLPQEVEQSVNASYVGKDELLARADHLLLVLPLQRGKPSRHRCRRTGTHETQRDAGQPRARRRRR